MDRRQLTSINNVRSLRVAYCDTDYYLVVAEVRGRLLELKNKGNV
jgi:hypothetical protein